MNNLITDLTLSSLEVAEMINKSHNDLLKDVRRYGDYLTEGKISLSGFWQESTYKDVTGRILKCYQITKKGCEFLAHKMTGKKGALFTATYINRFHEMEEELKTSKQAPQITTTMKDLIRYLIELRGVMSAAKQPKEKIATAFEMVSNQFGLKLPEFFVKDIPTEDMNINKIHKFVENNKKNKFEDYVASLTFPIKGSIEIKKGK